MWLYGSKSNTGQRAASGGLTSQISVVCPMGQTRIVLLRGKVKVNASSNLLSVFSRFLAGWVRLSTGTGAGRYDICRRGRGLNTAGLSRAVYVLRRSCSLLKRPLGANGRGAGLGKLLTWDGASPALRFLSPVFRF